MAFFGEEKMRFALGPENQMRRGCEAVKNTKEKATERNESRERTVKSYVFLAAHDGLRPPYCFTTIKPFIVLSPNRPAER